MSEKYDVIKEIFAEKNGADVVLWLKQQICEEIRRH